MVATSKVLGVGPAMEKALTEQGFKSAEDIAAATPARLSGVRGIGAATAPRLIAAAKAVIASEGRASVKKPPQEKKTEPAAKPAEPGEKKAAKSKKSDKKSGKKSKDKDKGKKKSKGKSAEKGGKKASKKGKSRKKS